MATIAIMGAGSFGTAMACAARRGGHSVRIWAREPEVVAAINSQCTNHVFLPDIQLETGIYASGDLVETLDAAEFVFIAVPSQFVRSLATQMRPALRPGTAVISCSKGIERNSCALMPEIIADTLPGAAIAVLAGPSFAKEVAVGQMTAVTVASTDAGLAKQLAGLLSSANFHAFTSNDPIAATIGGAFKNVLGIACGIAFGRKMGDNFRGLLIARGLCEMAQLASAKGGDPINLLGLAGSGDVVLSSMGSQSRNTRLGIALGEGQSAASFLANRNIVIEGVHTAESICELGRRLGLHLPVAWAVHRIVNAGSSVDAAIAELWSSPTGRELTLPRAIQ